MLLEDKIDYRDRKNDKISGLKINERGTFYDDRYKEKTYDIVLKHAPHNYFANGILVHNSHSASYAKAAYFCQWLKYYHPLAYWTATLEYAEDDVKKPENIWTLRSLIKRKGFKFLPPNALATRSDFHVSGEKITWPIRAIKGVGLDTALALAAVCEEKKPQTFEEFYEVIDRRKTNKRVVDNLIRAGAFSKFGHQKDIAALYWSAMRDDALGYMEISFRRRYSKFFSKSVSSLKKLKKTKKGTFLVMGGKVSRVYAHMTKTGRMFFIQVFDMDGEFLLVMLPDFFKRKKKMVRVGDVIEVVGKKGISNKGEQEIVLDRSVECGLKIMKRN